MSDFKQFKTPKLSVVLQVTETTEPGMDGRRWEVHDVERGRSFRATLKARELQASKTGRSFAEAEIETALGFAIEEALVSPPEKQPGETYDVEILSEHLRRSLREA